MYIYPSMYQKLMPIAFLFLVFVSTVAAQDLNTFTDSDHAANDGYDIVAYFEYGEPRKGDMAYSVQLPSGVVYLFSSEKTKKLFEADPQKYLPQYGGFCAYAMAKSGDKVKVDPNVWTIFDGKLYLNYSSSIAKRWNAKQAQYIQEADQRWAKILSADSSE